MKKTWTIAPLFLGSAVRDKSQTLLCRDYGVQLQGAILAWLLMKDEERMLVDAGVFGAVEKPGISVRYDQTPDQTMGFQLRRFNLNFDDIHLVINTHLHLDHAGGNTYFPHARFFAQKKEMEYARNPLPIHRGAYDMDYSKMDFEFIDGDAEIVPGIR
jgi:glyoxylase-like metal-dependent hydrolase (beta-lactamase superfamily II)